LPDESPAQLSLVPALPEPWPDPVDAANILAEVESAITRFLFLPEGASVAIALWTLHTYAYKAAQHFPILSALSPEKRCGKTTLLRLLKALVRQPVMASNFTPAVIYRLIDQYRPTLLIDEADTYLEGNQSLIGILNAGHIRDGQAVLNVRQGDDWTPRAFSAWSPKSIAAIGTLPPTLSDRSITLHLHRRPKSARVDRWESPFEDDFAILRSKMVRWSADHGEELSAATPRVPDALNDRAQDNWWPLLAIAEAAGGSWPKRGRDAALKLSQADADDLTIAEMLLEDFRPILEASPDGRIRSDDLITSLTGISGRPWADFKGAGRKLTPTDLSKLLKNYGIRPSKIRFGEYTYWGYKLDRHAIDIFERYAIPRSEPSELPEHDIDGVSNVPTVPPVPAPRPSR
jgi:putative DNA primase/helicase